MDLCSPEYTIYPRLNCALALHNKSIDYHNLLDTDYIDFNRLRCDNVDDRALMCLVLLILESARVQDQSERVSSVREVLKIMNDRNISLGGNLNKLALAIQMIIEEDFQVIRKFKYMEKYFKLV